MDNDFIPIFAFAAVFLSMGCLIGIIIGHMGGEDIGHEHLGKMICEEKGGYSYVGTKYDADTEKFTVVCEKETREKYDGGYIEIKGGDTNGG